VLHIILLVYTGDDPDNIVIDRSPNRIETNG
jgi:hypothetical protein